YMSSYFFFLSADAVKRLKNIIIDAGLSTTRPSKNARARVREKRFAVRYLQGVQFSCRELEKDAEGISAENIIGDSNRRLADTSLQAHFICNTHTQKKKLACLLTYFLPVAGQ